MAFILFQKGATSWGFQVGRFYMYWPFFQYLKLGQLPTFGVEDAS